MALPADIPASQRKYICDPSTGRPFDAAGPMPSVVAPRGLTHLGYQRAADVSSVIALPSIPADATVATVVVEGAGVRLRQDGGALTSTSGRPIAAGDVVTLLGAEIVVSRFIQQSAGAVLNVEYAK